MHQTISNKVIAIDERAAFTFRAIDAFISNMKSRGAKKDTCYEYRRIILEARTMIGAEPFDWTPKTWSELLRNYQSSGLSKQTLLIKQVAVRQFYRFVRNPEHEFKEESYLIFGGLLTCPVTQSNSISHTSVVNTNPDVRPVTEAEMDVLTRHLDDQAKNGSSRGAPAAAMMGCAIKVAVSFGLRSMELGSIRRRHCHAIAQSPQYGSFGRIDVVGKSKPYGDPRPRTVYTVPHFDGVVPVLEHYCGPDGPRGKLGDNDFLFTNERGKPISGNYFSRQFVRYCREIGLSTDATAHGMRRYYATKLYTLGVDLWFLSDQLGHEGASTTLRYIRFATNFREEKVHELQRSLFSGRM